MKFIAVATLFTLASAHDLHGRHAGAARLLAKRQATSTSATSSVSATSAASGTTAASKSTTTSAAVPVVQTTPIGAGTDIPPLSSILSGAAPEATASVTTVYPAGATPPISGAPALPSCMWLLFTSANYFFTVLTLSLLQSYSARQTGPLRISFLILVCFRGSFSGLSLTRCLTASSQVQEWLKELDGFDIPDLDPTADGTCVGDPVAAADAANRGWWTCGGYTRSTDIVNCPDKLTWGMRYFFLLILSRETNH